MSAIAQSLAEFFLSAKDDQRHWFRLKSNQNFEFFVHRVNDSFVIGELCSSVNEYIGDLPDDERQADFLATLALTIAEESITNDANVSN